MNKSYHFETQIRSLVEGAKNNLQVCILNTVRYVYIHTYKAGGFFYLALTIIIGPGNSKTAILPNRPSGKRKKNYINIHVH